MSPTELTRPAGYQGTAGGSARVRTPGSAVHECQDRRHGFTGMSDHRRAASATARREDLSGTVG